jgi:glucan endo-1,3-alpha-glucosidase
MIGNTFPYKLQDWADNVQMAYEAGFDGFALNMGTGQSIPVSSLLKMRLVSNSLSLSDDWQAKSIDMAYAAAQGFSPDFKLFISFDMVRLPFSLLSLPFL